MPQIKSVAVVMRYSDIDGGDLMGLFKRTKDAKKYVIEDLIGEASYVFRDRDYGVLEYDLGHTVYEIRRQEVDYGKRL